MVLVIVRPREESGDQLVQVRSDQFDWQRMDRQLNEAQGRLHDLSIRRCKVYEERREDFCEQLRGVTRLPCALEYIKV